MEKCGSKTEANSIARRENYRENYTMYKSHLSSMNEKVRKNKDEIS